MSLNRYSSSANNIDSHDAWVKDIEEVASHGSKVSFPIIADEKREVATLYDMLDALDKTNVDAKGIPFTVRTVFVSLWMPRSFMSCYC